MTKFLASVDGIQEAEIALAGGADIIDLKNPQDGALGAVSPKVIRETVAFVAGRRPVSAVCGNLPMEPGTVRAVAEEIAATKVDFLKIGFLSEREAAICARTVAPLSGRVRLVAVLFADKEPDFGLLPVLAESGFHGAMLDTAAKGKGGLLDHLPLSRIARFVDQANSLGLMTGLSGSLGVQDVSRLLPFQPDFLGFRGALCGRSQRSATIDPEAVGQIRALIPQEYFAEGSTNVDHEHRLGGRP